MMIEVVHSIESILQSYVQLSITSRRYNVID